MLIYPIDSVPQEGVLPSDILLPMPILSYNPQRKLWILREPYEYIYEGFIIHANSNFAFDLASIPKILWSIIGPYELSIAGPLVHDLLYDYRGNPQGEDGFITRPTPYLRKEADQIFLEIMRKENIPEVKCELAFQAVRKFGGLGWN